MAASLERRLKSWRKVLRNGGPAWLVEHAPKAIAEIEAEIARLTADAPDPGSTPPPHIQEVGD